MLKIIDILLIIPTIFGMSDQDAYMTRQINERSVSEVRQLLLLVIEWNEVWSEAVFVVFVTAVHYFIILYYYHQVKRVSPKSGETVVNFYPFGKNYHYCNPLVEAVLWWSNH